MIRKIQGKNIRQPAKHLQTPTGLITDPTDIASTLAQSISFNSSTQHYSPTFQQHKGRTELQEVVFPPTDDESYNTYITHAELKEAIGHAHDSTPGPDSVHYQMLKHCLLYTSDAADE